jgi:hypothetical protein
VHEEQDTDWKPPSRQITNFVELAQYPTVLSAKLGQGEPAGDPMKLHVTVAPTRLG